MFKVFDYSKFESRTWDNESYTSPKLGTPAYPLQRAMFHYIENHVYDSLDLAVKFEKFYIITQKKNLYAL